MERDLKLAIWAVLLSFAATLALCEEAKAQHDLPTKWVWDTAPIRYVGTNQEVMSMLIAVYNTANNEQKEAAACLYGRVSADTLWVRVAMWRGANERTRFMMAGLDRCPDTNRGLPLVGTAHTHITGFGHARTYHSNVDNRTFWKDERLLIDIILWKATEKGLYMTYHLRHGESGVWKRPF